MLGNIRPLEMKDAELILEWRNDDSVRLNMYNHEIISLETHLLWLKKTLDDNNSRYFIYEQEKIPLGLLSFTNIDLHSKKATWAFYSGNTTKRGIGSEMEGIALDYAFNTLLLNKLCCEVLEFNEAVIKFHRKFGFRIEGIKKADYCREGNYYDVYQLALFKKDYLKTKENQSVTIPKNYRWEFTIPFEKINAFANLSGDINPIHLNKAEAVKRGFKDRIAHGALLSAEISKVAAMDYPAKDPIYLSQELIFISPVYADVPLWGEANLKTKIGRFVIVEYNIYQQETRVASCESEFILSNEDN